MTDTRRVCDVSAGELFEAALAATVQLGWTRGPWRLELHTNDGVLRKLDAHPAVGRPIPYTLGRRALLDLKPPEAA